MHGGEGRESRVETEQLNDQLTTYAQKGRPRYKALYPAETGGGKRTPEQDKAVMFKKTSLKKEQGKTTGTNHRLGFMKRVQTT